MKQVAFGFAALTLIISEMAMLPVRSPQGAFVYPVIVRPELSVAGRAAAPAPGGSRGLDGPILQVKR